MGVPKAKLTEEDRRKLIDAGAQLKAEIASAQVTLEALQNRLQSEAQRLPNLTHPDVPIGEEENATVLKTVRVKPWLYPESEGMLNLGWGEAPV